MEHSHLAVDVNLIDKVDEEVMTPFGELKKSKLEDDVQYLKPKTNKADKEFLNQIAYLDSLINLVSNQELPRDCVIIILLSFVIVVHRGEREANSFERSRLDEDAVEPKWNHRSH